MRGRFFDGWNIDDAALDARRAQIQFEQDVAYQEALNQDVFDNLQSAITAFTTYNAPFHPEDFNRMLEIHGEKLYLDKRINCKKLMSEMKVSDVSRYASTHEKFGAYVIDNYPKDLHIFSQFSSFDLLAIGKNFPANANKILQNPKFVETLEKSGHLGRMQEYTSNTQPANRLRR